MSDAIPNSKRLPKTAWVVAYLVSPAIPFICLRIERAISTGHCILGMLAALVAHVGLVSVLAETNDDPLQFFIMLLLATSIYLIAFWQYVVGNSASLWSEEAQKHWRVAGMCFGAALVVALGIGIISFHASRFAANAEHRRSSQPPPRSMRGGNSGVPSTLHLAFPAAVAQLVGCKGQSWRGWSRE